MFRPLIPNPVATKSPNALRLPGAVAQDGASSTEGLPNRFENLSSGTVFIAFCIEYNDEKLKFAKVFLAESSRVSIGADSVLEIIVFSLPF